MSTDRYFRQRRLLGDEGQSRLKRSSVLVIGAGALGSTVSTLLVRAGLGRLRICDDDVLSLHNLPRQLLYDEDDLYGPIGEDVEAAHFFNSGIVKVAASGDRANLLDCADGCPLRSSQSGELRSSGCEADDSSERVARNAIDGDHANLSDSLNGDRCRLSQSPECGSQPSMEDHRNARINQKPVESNSRIQKIEIAAKKLRRMNRDCCVEPYAVKISEQNFSSLAAGMNLIIDCTDDLPFRQQLNRLCVLNGKPWIYGGVNGSLAMVAAFSGHGKPCFCCAFGEHASKQEPPQVLNAAPALCASYQSAIAIKALAFQKLESVLWTCDPWSGITTTVKLRPDPDCPICGNRKEAEGVSL